MYEKFTVEIITPDRTMLKSESEEVTIPSYEGEMGILRDHVPLITFLRPGFITIKNGDKIKFFVEEGVVEFSNNNLLILTSTIKDLKELDQSAIENLLQEAQKKLNKNSSDKEKEYMLHF